jgi:hypothetical protein
VVFFCEEHAPGNYLWLFLGRNVFPEIICGSFLRRTCFRKLFVAFFYEEDVLGNSASLFSIRRIGTRASVYADVRPSV